MDGIQVPVSGPEFPEPAFRGCTGKNYQQLDSILI
eukprot:SAG31_NODE_199_length_20573_cov_5.832129_15_plen_35_part_00